MLVLRHSVLSDCMKQNSCETCGLHVQQPREHLSQLFTKCGMTDLLQCLDRVQYQDCLECLFELQIGSINDWCDPSISRLYTLHGM